MSKVRSASLLLAVVLALATPARAQDPVFDANGFQPNRDYVSPASLGPGLQATEHVDPVTGSLILTFTDLVLPGNGGRDLVFQRTYNSKGSFGGDPGRWSFGIAGIPLTVDDSWPLTPDSHPTLRTADGGGSVAATNLYAPAQGQAIRMTDRFWKYYRNSRIAWLPDGSVAFFDAGLRLSSLVDAFQNTVLSLAYSTSGGTTTVTQHLGNGQSREIVVTFPAACYMTKPGCVPTSMVYRVDPADAQTWRTWTYTGAGLLAEVQPPVGPKWRYEYGISGTMRTMTTITPHGGSVLYTIENVAFPWTNGETVFTNVVRSRQAIDVRGGQSSGTWTFDYDWNGLDLAKSSVITAPDGTRTRYNYDYWPGLIANNGAPEYAGRAYLVTQRKVWQGASEPSCGDAVECESRQYGWIGIPSYNNVTLPEITSRSIVRAGRTHTTTYGYSGSSYGDFHQPSSIVENSGGGAGLLQRTTTRTFQHSANAPFDSPYLAGLLAGETVTGGGDTFTTTWTREAGTGFIQSTLRYGIPTTFGRDAFGNVATVTTATSKTTTTTYEWGVVKNTITPEYTISRTINRDGTVASEVQGARTTGYLYDALMRSTTVTPPGGTSPHLTVYDNANGATVTSIHGPATVTTTLDGFGRPIGTVAPISGGSDIRTTTRYDAFGRVAYAGYPFYGDADRGLAVTYDALGRVRRETHPDATYREYTYGTGTVTIRDELGRNTVQTVAAFGHPADTQLVTLVDAKQTTWTYTHDVLGSVRALAGGGVTRTWTYHATHHLLEQEVHPESGTTTYGYDNAGLLSVQTTPAGQTIYGRDGNDRVTSVNAGGRLTTISFEPGTDNRATLTVDGVVTQFRYDTAGRLDRRTDTLDGQSFVTTFGFDPADRLTQIEYPSGRLVRYDFDQQARLTRVFRPSGANYASGVSYHAAGGPDGFVAGNGLSTTRIYDPQRYWLRSVTSGPLQLTNLGYDATGNLETIVDARGGYSQTFEYDTLHRVTTATGPYGSLGYGHDVHGNLQTGAFTYTANPFRLATANGQSVGYDGPAGRLATVGSTTSYSYTPDHRLSSATAVGTTSTFRYDGDGWRVKKTVGGVSSYFARMPDGQLLAERLVVDGVTVWRDYVYGPTGLLAVEAPIATTRPASCLAFTDPALSAQVTPVRAAHVTELRACINALRAQRGLAAATWTDPTITPGVTPAKTAHITDLRSALAAVYTAAGASPPGYTDPTLSAGTTPLKAVHIGELRAATTAVPLPPPTIQTFYYHTDQIGSVRAITNAAAQTVGRYDFDPYGNELQPAATFRDPRLFAGGERDPETSLDYFGARYYGAHLGRFLTPDDPVFGDPLDPQSTNQYAYAYNNPLTFTDPTGRSSECAPGMSACATAPDPLKELERWASEMWALSNRLAQQGLDVMREQMSEQQRIGACVMGDNPLACKGLREENVGAAVIPSVATLQAGQPAAAALLRAAQKLYPGKAGKFELHHIVPKYLGGAAKGARVRLDAAYHQLITNEFRQQWPYGSVLPSTQQLQELLQRVYAKFPLP